MLPSEEILLAPSSCDVQFSLQDWMLIDFAVVESRSIITSNYMFLLPCQCLHVLCLILDCTIKPLPTLICESSNNYGDCQCRIKAGNQKRLSVSSVWETVFCCNASANRRWGVRGSMVVWVKIYLFVYLEERDCVFPKVGKHLSPQPEDLLFLTNSNYLPLMSSRSGRCAPPSSLL